MSEIAILADASLYNVSGLIWVVLGVYVLIRATGFPDLTVDGSFTIGAAVYAVALTAGVGTALSLTAGALAGAVGGLSTWAVNRFLGVGKIVSGVLVMIILILSAPYVTLGATRSLLGVQSWFAWLDAFDHNLTASVFPGRAYQLHIAFTAVTLTAFALIATQLRWSLYQPTGLKLRYFGGSPNPTLLSENQKRWLCALGLAAGNALVAVGGAIEAQRRGGFTLNMGTGMILIGITALVLGESLIKSFRRRDFLHVSESILAVIVGTVVYCLGVQLLLLLGIGAVDIKLLTALFLLVLLAIAGRYFSSSTRLF